MARLLPDDESAADDAEELAHERFPRRLKRLATDANASVEELAGRVGVHSSGSWSRWLRGGFPNYNALYAMNVRLGVNLNWLLTGLPIYAPYVSDSTPLAASVKIVRDAAIRMVARTRNIPRPVLNSLPEDDDFVEAVAEMLRARCDQAGS